MEFFNITVYFSTLVLGIVTAMEERRAKDPNFDTSSINNVKASLMGPLSGMIPGIISNLIGGVTTDIYALYYLPVQMITGGIAGLLFQKISFHERKRLIKILLGAGIVSIPGTVISSSITAIVFGGITSSGSTLLVQLLHHLGLGLTASVCIVQGLTDYADRAIVLALTVALLAVVPSSIKIAADKEKSHGKV